MERVAAEGKTERLSAPSRQGAPSDPHAESTIRLVLVDDHQLIRNGVRSVLASDPRFEVVGEAGTGTEALDIIIDQRPEMALVDLRLPDVSGMVLCERIRRACPDTMVVVLTAYVDRHLVDGCLRAGAQGYLLKDAENLCLSEHLLAVANGHLALDPRAADVLGDYVRQYDPPPDMLMSHELDELQLIAQGLTDREIGAELGMDQHTVGKHVEGILKKLGVRSRVQAVLAAQERGLL